MHYLRLPLILALCLTALSACENGSATTGNRKPAPKARLIIEPNPVKVSPISYQTCTQHYGFMVGTPQYKKCIENLSQLETPPAVAQ